MISVPCTEAGEIPDDSRSASPPADYDPAFEWPGEEKTDGKADVGPSTEPSFRLVVLRTSVLPAKQTVVISDGYTELQFGRDPAPSQDIPRVRLKEMEVSKLHATAYATHGTFLQSRSSVTAVRLSPPRVASVPRILLHLDTLAIGSTTFIVHIHPQQTPCSDCCSTSENEVPLFSSSHKRTVAKVPEPDTGYLPASSGNPKKALTMLKQRLLTTSSPGPIRSEGTYTDRSARRRSLYPASRLDAPGVAPPRRAEAVASTSQQTPPSAPWVPPPQVTTSQPPTPLPTTNIGHRLLLAQGWAPGSSLGASEASPESDEGRIRLTAPLEVVSTSHRAGIGMAKGTIPTTGGSWREDGRQRRWGDVT
ncbi:hypothetical protein K438DRAFT_1817325 [Mycena galopus ATCC 62051]|nr:hypothetical protein K438DRAFT_1817325 [Mycena galopus ATCC 62051]